MALVVSVSDRAGGELRGMLVVADGTLAADDEHGQPDPTDAAYHLLVPLLSDYRRRHPEMFGLPLHDARLI